MGYLRYKAPNYLFTNFFAYWWYNEHYAISSDSE